PTETEDLRREADTDQGRRKTEQDKLQIPYLGKIHRRQVFKDEHRQGYQEYKFIHFRRKYVIDPAQLPEHQPQHHHEKDRDCRVQAEDQVLHVHPPPFYFLSTLLLCPQRCHRVALRRFPGRDDPADQCQHHAQQDQDDRRHDREHSAYIICPCQEMDQHI